MNDTPDVAGAGAPEGTLSFGAAPAAEPRRHQVEFTGTGSEYFRIWIVNLLLTVVTLGIYSAWAKVRKLQYFYRNTRVDGAVFDYHGRPWPILKGRLIVLAMLVFYNVAFRISILLGVAAGVALMVAFPWLLAQSQRFRLHNSSYRGLRFRFLAGPRELYLLFAVPLLVLLLMGLWTFSQFDAASGEPPDPRVAWWVFAVYGALALVWPYLHWRFKRYQHANSAYGETRATFGVAARSFYWIYLKAFGLGVLAFVGLFLVGLLSSGVRALSGSDGASVISFVAGIVLFYVAILSIGPYVMARVQNGAWNGTRIGPVGFESRVRARRLAWIVATNLVLTVLTLGLFTPFAAVRSARYKLESVAVLSDDLAGFAGAAGQDVSAVGEGAADMFDIDFAL